ncbi:MULTISPECIES: methionine ABC transporter ATP-binding protein [unclassified Helicobacter]|uniref:methionine ABC transporter ATP-binding protein n=1 Tax=unclassified Helicobacter TaxID=2593540 RepID=UPI000CF0BDD9|nr:MULTISPECIES: ATP-binding cassette domain-containing protein [unclassified Helicobacter]
MIRLENIEKFYSNGFCAIKKLDLEIERGDVFGIVGYSGAGKSTLIRLINRLELPTKGKVFIQGQNILDLNESQLRKQRQKIGMIFQHFNLLSSKNVFENVALALHVAKWKKDLIEKRVLELLNLVGLNDKRSFYPSQLSGGQKQRVAIARALANYPDILLCDEATSALDIKTTKDILRLLQEIQQKLQITVVLITHQMEIVRSICNKVCVIDKGEIVEKGFVKDVFFHPKHPVTKELIQSLFHQEQDSVENNTLDKNVYEFVFLDKNQDKPIISQAIKKFDIDVNVLYAGYTHFSADTFGHMILKLSGSQVLESLDWFKKQNIEIILRNESV